MKTQWTHKEVDKEINDILKRKKFPVEFPICHKNYELGILKIDFEYKDEKLPLKKKLERAGYLQGSLANLKGLFSFLEDYIECESKIIEKFLDDQTKSSALMEIMMMSSPQRMIELFKLNLPRTLLGKVIYAKEDGLFELIRNEGPIILCNPDVYDRLQEFIADKEIAGLKINRLRDSLLEYAYDKPIEKIPAFPMGRRAASLAQHFGAKGIHSSYDMMRLVFKYVKKHQKNKQISDMNDFFLKIGRGIIEDLLVVSKEEFQDHPKSIAMSKLYDSFLLHVPFYFLLQFINRDKELNDEFSQFDWEPNKLAKKTLAKLLDISVSKLEKILYDSKSEN